MYLWLKNVLNKPPFTLSVFCGLFIVFIDQFLKYKIRQSGGFFLCNSGISFGIKLPISTFWPILSVFLLFLMIYFVFLYNQKVFFPNLLFLGISLLMGGALSNVLDRFFLGCVLDYIYIFKKFFPIFNIADISISCGLLFIFFSLVKKPKIVDKL